jgi:SnoaL-like domain
MAGRALDPPVTGAPRVEVSAQSTEGTDMTDTATLTPVLAEYIAAVNAFDEDAIVATFVDDALVNDARREFWGTQAIRRWVAREIVGDRVTIEVTEVLDHHGDTIVRGRYDGDYDKTNLPDELILTSYFTVRGGKIVTLIIIRNTLAS